MSQGDDFNDEDDEESEAQKTTSSDIRARKRLLQRGIEDSIQAALKKRRI